MPEYTSNSLEKRSVVSCFIFRFPPNKPTIPVVALFRRSEKVHTYCHRLAPIAGSISPKDNTPLAAAWRELSEETSLTPATLTLWRIGKPFTFDDETVNREWTIHPFAFRLIEPPEGGKGEDAIHIDWEHEGWEWYDPRAVWDEVFLDSVPRLKESLRRVWFEGETDERTGKALAMGLERLQTDHESGSQELTSIALTVFRDFVVHTRDGLDEKWWDTVRMVAWHLVKNGRESMGAATLNAVLSVLREIEEIMGEGSDQEKKWDRILAMIDFRLAQRAEDAGRVMGSFTRFLKEGFGGDEGREKVTILTLSASSTIKDSVLDAFAALDVQMVELRVLESRPLFEGATIASSILCRFKSKFKDTDKKLHVKLYTDASAALAAEDVDIVLLGADRISAVKGVSNKTGSLSTVLSAKHITPTANIVVLSGLEKINGSTGIVDDEKHEDNGPIEVINTWVNDGVRGTKILREGLKTDTESNITVDVKNIYFEWVPLHLIDTFVCEDGVLEVDSIHDKSRQLDELANRYFGTL